MIGVRSTPLRNWPAKRTWVDRVAWKRAGAVLAWLALGTTVMGNAVAEPAVRGTARIIDGDSLEVSGRTFDLVGVDAPELSQRCLFRDRLYDCGAISRTALMDLTAGTEVECRPLSAAAQETVARCTAGGYDLSEGMVYTGWALAQRDSSPTRYTKFETTAADAEHGLWRGVFLAPWDWRDGKRLPQEEQQ